MQPLSSRAKAALGLAALLSAVLVVYLSHFQNGFHFDDMHAVVQNPYIRDLRNIPHFFTDARTFSVLLRNRTYRPLVSASLAVDYWLGGGLKPFYFQLSTFCWYLVQLVVMYALFRKLFDIARPDPRNHLVALAATAWYGLHPAMAETVNYVIQRGDLYSTLGVIAGIAVYAYAPQWRKFGLYLLPVAAALLSKPPALVFPALLLLYIWMFEENAEPRRFLGSLWRTAPAFLVTGAFGVLNAVMTPKTFNPGTPSAYAYRITQPLVAWHYFQTFFTLGGLTADTDHEPVASLWSSGAWLGFLFLIGLVALAMWLTKIKEARPVAFGIWWFLIAQIPTAIYPLAEVENDHRMFFPFVGLVVATSWPIALWIYHRAPAGRLVRIAFVALCALEMAVLGLGTVQRNVVWRTEESLWRDVTIKSPGNGRGLMNYGLTLVAKGDLENGRAYLERAKPLTPNYPLLEANLGIVYGQLNQPDEAEEHFRHALRMNPAEIGGRCAYARWLSQNYRDLEALDQLQIALKLNPDYLDAVYDTLLVQTKRTDWPAIDELASKTLRRFPADKNTQAYRLMAAWRRGELSQAAPEPKRLDTAENFLTVSALFYEAERFDDSIESAREALKRRPDYAEAYSNIAAAYRCKESWNEAIGAAREALRIRPGFKMAERNLARAQERKQDPRTP